MGRAFLRVGVAVGTSSVRAIVVRRGRIVWTREAPLAMGEDRAAGLAQLLAAIPVRRWPRTRVNVAVGPAYVHTKRIVGLPAVADRSVLARILSESHGRFFLRNGIPLAISEVDVDPAGGVWAAAFERPLIEDLADACRATRLPLGVVAPTVTVLSRALKDERIGWSDEQVAVTIETHAGRVVSLRRSVTHPEPIESAPVPVPPLAALGASALDFADAYGAALADARDASILRLRRRPTEEALPAWRLTAASAALVIALIAAFAMPVLALRRESSRAAATLAALAKPRREAEAVAAELRRISTTLNGLAAFGRTRRSATLLLAGVTRSLPEGTALAMVRLDTTTVTLVVLAPRATAVLAALERWYEVTAPTIVGPVTKEIAAGHEVERATIRFTLRPLPTPPVVATAKERKAAP